MKRLLFAWCLVILSLPANGQRKQVPRVNYSPESKIDKYNCQCVHRNSYTVTQRSKFYPFNRAAKIELVSYNGAEGPNEEVITDSIYMLKQAGKYHPVKIKRWDSPFADHKVDTSQFMQAITLSKSQVNNLTDLFFNIRERKHNPYIVYGEMSCFDPRNAIIFINSKGEIFAFIEICFECQKIEPSSDKINFGGWCLQKMDKIKQYFASVGIQYGVTTRVMPLLRTTQPPSTF